MLRLAIIALSAHLASSICCQSYRVDDLLHQDWQHRNAAARALADAQVGVDELLRVLGTEWHGRLPEFKKPFGLGGHYLTELLDPRRKVLRKARRVAAYQGALLAWHRELASANDLIVPWHPHVLACWLLLQRPATKTEQALEPTSLEMARAWLHVMAPDDEAIVAAATTKDRTNDLIVGLWLQGKRGRDTLRRLLVRDVPKLASAILRLNQYELLDNDARLAAVVDRFLNDINRNDRGHAGYMLKKLGRRGAEALAAFPIEKSFQRTYACQLLCLLDANAAPAVTLLADSIDSGMKSRRAALVALASIEIPVELQTTIAERAFEAFEKRELQTKLLALDVIGNCGDGVGEGRRQQLVALLEEPKRDAIKPRLLGCLHALGIATELSTDQKVALAEGETPSTATWLAVANDGVAGAKRLRRMLPNVPVAVDEAAVWRHLANTAPHAVRQWVDDQDRAVQTAAIEALHANARDSDVPTAKLVELLPVDNRLADQCLDWLAERKDSAGFAPKIFAHVIQRSERWLPGYCKHFVQHVDLPAITKLTLLEPLLRKGLGWKSVRSCAPEVLRQECRRWIAATEDASVRDTLVGELCRAGLETDDDVRLVLETLASKHRSDTLEGLATAPSLPAPIRESLIAVLFEEDDDPSYTDDWHAREALLAHREQ